MWRFLASAGSTEAIAVTRAERSFDLGGANRATLRTRARRRSPAECARVANQRVSNVFHWRLRSWWGVFRQSRVWRGCTAAPCRGRSARSPFCNTCEGRRGAAFVRLQSLRVLRAGGAVQLRRRRSVVGPRRRDVGDSPLREPVPKHRQRARERAAPCSVAHVRGTLLPAPWARGPSQGGAAGRTHVALVAQSGSDAQAPSAAR